jgi:hypothetical protein
MFCTGPTTLVEGSLTESRENTRGIAKLTGCPFKITGIQLYKLLCLYQVLKLSCGRTTCGWYLSVAVGIKGNCTILVSEFLSKTILPTFTVSCMLCHCPTAAVGSFPAARSFVPTEINKWKHKDQFAASTSFGLLVYCSLGKVTFISLPCPSMDKTIG